MKLPTTGQIIAIGILLFALTGCPESILGQQSNAPIKIELNQTTLPQALRQLEKSTDYKFMFSTDDLRQYTVTKSINAKSIKDALQAILAGKPLEYKVKGKLVYVYPSDKKVSKKETKTNMMTVSGEVTDDKNEPIIGATILVKGSNNGTATDINGDFTIKCPIGATLAINYIGMQPVEYKISPKDTHIKVAMLENVNELTEIVVTGYQGVKRETMTGSVTTVSSEKLSERYTPNLLDNLEGRVAGLSTYGGKPVIRGTGTLYGSTQPLLVVDGVPIEGSMDDLNPYDIASINVLKDAAAAAIYGARAANGIIVVTTKNAKDFDKIDVDFSANMTWHEKINVDYHDNFYMNAAEHVAAESDYLEYYYFGGIVKNPLENVTRNITNGAPSSPLNYAYWQFAKGDITRDQLDQAKARLSKNNFAKDLADNTLRRRMLQQYNLSVRNRSRLVTNNIVLNYKYDNSGKVGQDDKWLNVSYKGIFDMARWLTATLSFNGVFSDSKDYGGDYNTDVYDIFSRAPYYPFYAEDGSQRKHYFLYGNEYPEATLQKGITDMGTYYLDEIRNNTVKTRRHEMRFHADLLFKILPGLTANTKFIYEISDINSRQFANEESWEARFVKNLYATQSNGSIKYQTPENGGLLQTTHSSGNYWTARGQLNYTNTFFDKHEITAIAGIEFRSTLLKGEKTLLLGYDDQLQSSLTNTVDLGTLLKLQSSPYWRSGGSPVTTYTSPLVDGIGLIPEVHHKYASGYFNATYTYDQRYNIFGSFRKDYADVYGLNAKYRGKPLWSVGAGWNIHNESFLHDITWVNFLKLRYSYGVTGNIYQGATSYMTATSNETNYFTQMPMGTVSSPANPQLRWEQNRTHNAGLDFSLLGFRLRGSIDYYHKAGKDIFGTKILDMSTGFTSMNANVASIVNKGVELALSYDWFQYGVKRDFSWTTSMTFSFNSNEVTYVENPAKTAANLLATPFKTGYPVNAMWAFQFAGIDDTQGSEGQNLYWTTDNSKTHRIRQESADVLKYVGQSDPKTIISMDNQLRWKSFWLGFTMGYYGGHKMFALPLVDRSAGGWSKPVDLPYLNAWTPDNPTDIPGVGQWANCSSIDSAPQTSTNCVYDADFLKLRNAVIGWEMPKRWLQNFGVDRLAISFQVNDPKAIWTKNKAGIDPETLRIRKRSSYVVGINLNL